MLGKLDLNQKKELAKRGRGGVVFTEEDKKRYEAAERRVEEAKAQAKKDREARRAATAAPPSKAQRFALRAFVPSCE